MKNTLKINRQENATKLISPFILLCLILQAGAAVRLFCLGDTLSFIPGTFNVACDPVLYPFLSYGMYSSANYEGDTVKKYTLMANLTDGKQVVFDHKSLKMKNYKFKIYTANLEKDEKKLSEAITMYETLNSQEIQQVFVVIDTYKITKDGIKTLPKTVGKTIFSK